MRSGSNVSFAKRAPIVGITPNALARISPSPRNTSAQAATHTSPRVTSAMDGRLVLLLARVQVPGLEREPRLRVGGGSRVFALERFVALVVRDAGREVRAPRGLHHAIHQEPVDPERVHGALGEEPL